MSELVSQPSPCKSCARLIRWINTDNGRPMPVEAVAHLFVTEKGRTVKLWQPHWGNCEFADQHRQLSLGKGAE